MKAFVRVAMLFMVLFVPAMVPATPIVGQGEVLLLARENQGRTNAESAPRIGSQQAAALVKRRYGDGKILSVNLIENRESPVYRVKVLSAGGVVKYVYVDGVSGEVSE